MTNTHKTLTRFAQPNWNRRGLQNIFCDECQKKKVSHPYDWWRGEYVAVQTVSPSVVGLMPAQIRVDLIGFSVEQTVHRGRCTECGTLYVFAWPVITDEVPSDVLRERDFSGQTAKVVKQIERDFAR